MAFLQYRNTPMLGVGYLILIGTTFVWQDSEGCSAQPPSQPQVQGGDHQLQKEVRGAGQQVLEIHTGGEGAGGKQEAGQVQGEVRRARQSSGLIVRGGLCLDPEQGGQ